MKSPNTGAMKSPVGFCIFAVLLVLGAKSFAELSVLESALSGEFLSTLSSNSASSHLDVAVSNNGKKGAYFEYKSKEEHDARSTRFPSVDERVRLYMSNWYVPPCPGNDLATIRVEYRNSTEPGAPPDLYLREAAVVNSKDRETFIIPGTIPEGNRKMFYLDREVMEPCDKAYCKSIREVIYPTLDSLADIGEDETIPSIFLFGDDHTPRAWNVEKDTFTSFPAIPSLQKFRPNFPPGTLAEITEKPCNPGALEPRPVVSGQLRFQPIITKLTHDRHFGMLSEIPSYDTPWSKKKNKAVFRGLYTGLVNWELKSSTMWDLEPKEFCLGFPRCFLVHQYANSKLIDAKLVGDPIDTIPPVIDGVHMFAEEPMHYTDLLKYKALIMLEGHDVSTGLKWALYSQSVVMIPPPTRTAWSMEELLEPWVHYVPLNHDLSDVEEKMQWIIDNDAEAQQIARRAFLWIQDMFFHEDAEKDEDLISTDIIRRYRSHFVV